MKSNLLHYLRLLIAAFVAAMCSARISITFVASANIDSRIIRLMRITTVYEKKPFLIQLTMRWGMICPIDIYPGIILLRVIIRVPVCLDLVHRLEILLVTAYHRRWTVLITYGFGSARDSRSHGNRWPVRGRFGCRNNSRSRRCSGSGQNNHLRNTNN